MTIMQEKILTNFEIANNQEISGLYDPSNKNKKFTLWSNNYINIKNHSNIKGKTASGMCVSLIDCLSNTTSHAGDGERKYTSEVYSHTLIIGNEHIDSGEANIETITINVANPYQLLSHLKSFGYIKSPSEELINELNKQEYTPKFERKKNPSIAYFNGDSEIFKYETHIGIVSLKNMISTGGFGGPTGVHLTNTVYIELQFNSCKLLKDSFSCLTDLTRFFRFIGGEGLFFKDIAFKKNNSEHFLTVIHDSYDWGHEPDDSYYNSPLIDIESDAFGDILRKWFEKEDRKVVRSNFYNTYFKNIYTSDRLISTANIFDIFPANNTDKEVTLNPDLVVSLRKIEGYINSELEPYNKERKKLLGMINSLSKNTSRKTLRDRINERLTLVDPQNFNLTMDEVKTIIGYGIKARNYFVHGRRINDISVDQIYEYQVLFVQCFEFIYAVSELIECGWKPQEHSLHINRHRLGGMAKDIKYNYAQLLKSIEEHKD